MYVSLFLSLPLSLCIEQVLQKKKTTTNYMFSQLQIYFIINFQLPVERSNLNLLHDSSIYEGNSTSKDSDQLCIGLDKVGSGDSANRFNGSVQSTVTGRPDIRIDQMNNQSTSGDPEANCLCCCFTTFCLVMSIILLTASAVLAIIHGGERRKMSVCVSLCVIQFAIYTTM